MNKFGMADTIPSPLPVGSGAGNGVVTTTPAHRAFLDPQSPELWLVGIGAACLGLIALSTSVKVGPFKFAGSVG